MVYVCVCVFLSLLFFCGRVGFVTLSVFWMGLQDKKQSLEKSTLTEYSPTTVYSSEVTVEIPCSLMAIIISINQAKPYPRQPRAPK